MLHKRLPATSKKNQSAVLSNGLQGFRKPPTFGNPRLDEWNRSFAYLDRGKHPTSDAGQVMEYSNLAHLASPK